MTRASDATVAIRWVRNVDRYWRLSALADKSVTVAGPNGSQKVNPLYALVAKFEASIRDDERQLGIGPLSRLKMGVTLSAAAKSLAELNDESEDDDDYDNVLATLRVIDDVDPDGES